MDEGPGPYALTRDELLDMRDMWLQQGRAMTVSAIMETIEGLE